jgi:hypothetical protein
MATYKIFPTKDTTLYSEYPEMNTGLDSILECSSYLKSSVPQSSRYLIQFSSDEINNIIDEKIINSDYKVYLKNYVATISGLNLDTKLYIYPIFGVWGMGTGHYADSPIQSNGSSWTWRDYADSNLWSTSSFSQYVTASFIDSNPGGGTWYTGSSLGLNIEHTQSFYYGNSTDLNVDVTNTIVNWYTGALDNNGFIVKQDYNNEFSSNPSLKCIFKYFSIDTNTIYPPYLEFKWDDYTFNTGSSSNTIISTPEAFISIYNNKGTYYPEDIIKFRISAIPKYPQRQFITGSNYTKNYYLPSNTSLYAIKDSKTNEFVIDFDTQYTKISADSVSSYFNVYANGLEPERYYTILIKTILDNTTIVFDEDIMFKVVKG